MRKTFVLDNWIFNRNLGFHSASGDALDLRSSARNHETARSRCVPDILSLRDRKPMERNLDVVRDIFSARYVNVGNTIQRGDVFQ